MAVVLGHVTARGKNAEHKGLAQRGKARPRSKGEGRLLPWQPPASFNRAKAQLIDYMFAQPRRPTTLADLGGCWNVDGAYTAYALEHYRPRGAVLVDTALTPATRALLPRYPALELVSGAFGDPAIRQAVGAVDAVLLFDVLLHQVAPDWDAVRTRYAEARYLAIYNPQWTGARTTRLVDLGPEGYFQHVPHTPEDEAYRRLFETPSPIHPTYGRPWRDIHEVWQWGITDADLLAHAQGLGYELV
jgi:hypothetical protein